MGEEIDVGEDAGPRTVVSGLVKYVPLDQLENSLVLVLCNMKPANMRGIKSHAMVLAASNADHTSVELVRPPEGTPVGEVVEVPGFEHAVKGDADEQMNPKKKIFETVQPHLATNDALEATYKDAAFTVSTGTCKVASLTGAAHPID